MSHDRAKAVRAITISILERVPLSDPAAALQGILAAAGALAVQLHVPEADMVTAIRLLMGRHATQPPSPEIGQKAQS